MFEEGKEAGVEDIQGPIRIACLNNARDVDFASTCRILASINDHSDRNHLP